MITQASPSTANRAGLEDSTDFLQVHLLDLLRRRRGLILLFVLTSLALAGIYCVVATTRYESSAEILIIPKDSRITSTTGNMDLAMERAVGDELLATHMRIITSPRVIGDAIENRGLLDVKSLTANLPRDSVPRKDKVIKYIRENMSVERGGAGAAKDAQVLQVSLHHVNDEDCATTLEAIIESYQNFLGDTHQSAGGQAAALITKAGDDLEQTVKDQDEKYREFLQEAPMLWNSNGANLNPHHVRLANLETELSNLQLQKSKVASRLELARKVISNDTQDVLEKMMVFDGADADRLGLLVQMERGYPTSEAFQQQMPLARVEVEQLLALNLKAKSDLQRVGPNHPKYHETQQQIDQVQEFLKTRNVPTGEAIPDKPSLDLDRLVMLYERLLQHDLDEMSSRETELVTYINGEQAKAKELIKFELEETSQRRGMERTQALYAAVVDRVREINLLKDYGGFITKLLSPPRIGEKSWPNIPILLALGALVGLLGGTGVAVVAELADRSFRGPQDIERELSTTVLAHIPALGVNRENPVPGEVMPAVVTLHKPKSKNAEAFRRLRTSLLFRTKAVDNPVIQITSPNPGDGKSTLVANLAVSLAQTSKRVLLIDCDMRRPTMHKVFGVNQKPGMSSVLLGEETLDSVIVDSDQIPNLSFLPAGKATANPAELLNLPDFRDVLEMVRKEFDFVLIDSPPVEPVADPISIASVVDYVLVALTLSGNSRAVATHTCSQLVGNGGNLLGLVVNRSSESRNGYGKYGYGYGGRYGYGSYGYEYRGEYQKHDSYYG